MEATFNNRRANVSIETSSHSHIHGVVATPADAEAMSRRLAALSATTKALDKALAEDGVAATPVDQQSLKGRYREAHWASFRLATLYRFRRDGELEMSGAEVSAEIR